MNLENEQAECAEQCLQSTSEALEQGALGTISEACNGPSSDGPLMELTEKLSYPSTDLPKVGSLVPFQSTDPTKSGKNFKTRVVSHAGKTTGKHRSWFNLEYLEPLNLNAQKRNLDWEKEVDRWESVPDHVDDGSSILCATVHTDTLHQAELEELQIWRDIGVYTTVPDKGQDFITGRWVLTVTNGRNEARLVAHGFQNSSSSTGPALNDSPTYSKESLRIILKFSQKLEPQFVTCQSGGFARPFSQPWYIPKTSKASRSTTHLVEAWEVCIWLRWRIEILVFTGEDLYDRERADRLTPWQLPCLPVKFHELLRVICCHVDDFL